MTHRGSDGSARGNGPRQNTNGPPNTGGARCFWCPGKGGPIVEMGIMTMHRNTLDDIFGWILRCRGLRAAQTFLAMTKA